MRIIVRILLLRKAGILSDDQWKEIMEMEGHSAQFKASAGEIWEKILVMSMGATGYTQVLPEEIVREIYCKVSLHAILKILLGDLLMCI